jgi:copper chaperone CopZ
MKKIKTIFITGVIIMTVLISQNLFAQEIKADKYSKIDIKTSAQCGMCKETIEKALAFESGVKNSNLNLDTKIVTVKYNPNKTNPDKIKIAISKAGYDADELQADPEAYDKLSPCCKKDGPKHE